MRCSIYAKLLIPAACFLNSLHGIVTFHADPDKYHELDLVSKQNVFCVSFSLILQARLVSENSCASLEKA